MHQPGFSGDSPGFGSRKTGFHYRRGSSGASLSSVAGNGGVNMADDNPTQAGSSSPGPHHQAQSQMAGAQVKKKSGFQIISVTSAQISVSSNKSLADDTENYDMDESHTKDFSSSDILDVSVSRATDTGVPERSSSDETLNSLHGVDTPGLVSPNEPLHPQHQTSLGNGAMHHHYYSQHHSQPPHHRSDSLGGVEPSLPSSSSPAMSSKAGPSHSQRPPVLDKTKPASGITQKATGSRFRVVKLHTNIQPFRKGRWTCTEYYEKEIPHPTTSETPKGAEVAAETEPGNAGISPGILSVQPLHTLQFYQPQSQDFTSPQAMQSPPQGLSQTTPLTFVSPQEVVGGAHVQKSVAPVILPTATPQVLPQAGVSQPPSLMPQQLPYAVDTHQAQPHAVYPAPQLHAGVIPPGSVRQPDFIQPTAPFQPQVQPPLPHVTKGLTPLPGVPVQPQIPIQPQSHAQPQVPGISAEASAIMAAAATGLRSQHAEGEDDSSSGASVVAMDNKIGQAMDLVKSHMMCIVRKEVEEVEELKKQNKELIERITELEQENNLLKTLTSPEQMAQFQVQGQTSGSPTSTAQPPVSFGSTRSPPLHLRNKGHTHWRAP